MKTTVAQAIFLGRALSAVKTGNIARDQKFQMIELKIALTDIEERYNQFVEKTRQETEPVAIEDHELKMQQWNNEIIAVVMQKEAEEVEIPDVKLCDDDLYTLFTASGDSISLSDEALITRFLKY